MEKIILVVVNIQDVPETDCHRFESKHFPENPKFCRFNVVVIFSRFKSATNVRISNFWAIVSFLVMSVSKLINTKTNVDRTTY